MSSIDPDLLRALKALCLLLPFVAIFLWAAWLELRRWWRYGPAENQRSRFPIDEGAPSYEDPDEPKPRPADD
ncbi:hypothetical protein [Poseidonocella pacifica]|uniref:hypothetical protein n=1 Tax=Poseidonocella pacifica TaxID=871651 RepID=UPI000B87C3EF|nr:hypothetical protein [Poseidonocella pacifica]